MLAAYFIYEGVSRLFVDEPPWLARAERCAWEARDSRLAITDAADTRLRACALVSTFVGLLAFTAFSIAAARRIRQFRRQLRASSSFS